MATICDLCVWHKLMLNRHLRNDSGKIHSSYTRLFTHCGDWVSHRRNHIVYELKVCWSPAERFRLSLLFSLTSRSSQFEWIAPRRPPVRLGRMSRRGNVWAHQWKPYSSTLLGQMCSGTYLLYSLLNTWNFNGCWAIPIVFSSPDCRTIGMAATMKQKRQKQILNMP